MKRLALLLLLTLIFTACGGSNDVPAAIGGPTSTIELNHTLFRGVINRVSDFRITGFQVGQSVFGPVVLPKATQVRVLVPTIVNRIRIEYLDGDQVVGTHEQDVSLQPDQVTRIDDPEILLLVGTTTLDRSIVTTGTGQYKTLTYGPAWTQVVRTDLGATAQPDRETRRVSLLCMPHFSDVHIIDEESPLRIEFLRNLVGAFLPKTEFQAAWRPQEMLTVFVTEAMIRQINSIGAGPTTGRPYDCAVFTGDNGDNRHQSELERFLTLLDGGQITPSTGNPDLYEGVQDNSQPFLAEYWHPEPGPQDQYKQTYGFPNYPGLLAAAVQTFQAEGLKTPYYSAYGNHDHLLQGNFPEKVNLNPQMALNQIATSTTKILALPQVFQLLEKIKTGSGVDLFLAEFLDPLGINSVHDWPAFIGHWTAASTPSRQVTADPTRHLLQRTEFIQAHLDTPAVPGPVGHGFTAQNLQTGNMYYAFEPAPGILGLTLDTTNPGGENNGSIDVQQVAWMEQQIQQVSSRYYDANGNLIQTGNQDKLVILFSHHSIETMDNALPDPENPGQIRMLGGQFEQVLHRYPNVVAWLNGHTHYCRIFPHPDPTARTGGFWEVNSPSLIDFPQQARIVELVDNQDGTLSIFATLVDTAAPPETGAPGDPLSLASISRELSANDPQILDQPATKNEPGGLGFQIGNPNDRNVELLVKKPF
ncbi:MAG: metallophosphoesterase [Candidatus Xenobia bacterium]